MDRLINVFFDLDGTLVDPSLGFANCIRYALERLKKISPDKATLEKFIGPPLRGTFAKLLNTHEPAMIESAVALYRERYAPIGIFENEVYPGIGELLADLHANSFKIYVVTSKARSYAEIIVGHFFNREWFADIFGSGLDGSLDNKVELIEFIMGTLKPQPKRTVMIGDRKEDVVAGKANHLKTIGVTYGYGTRAEIVAAGPDYICASPSEIGVRLSV
jgi:phosphoglycolate phosphatase